MESSISVPIRQRIVEIIAESGAGSAPRFAHGSGFLIGNRMVLTAAHVVNGATGVTIRRSDKVSWPATLKASLVGNPDRFDLALLEVPELPDELPYLPVALVDRDVETGEFLDNCWSVGYPVFQEIKRDGDLRSTRVSAHVRGYIPVLSGLGDRLGLLSLKLDDSLRAIDAHLPSSYSVEWSGFSGAAVFAGEFLIGVVIEHVPQRGIADLTLIPFDRLLAPASAPVNASYWWECLGVNNPENLPHLHIASRTPADLSVPEHHRPEPAYRATIRVIRARTNVLLDREDELSFITKFATSEMGESTPLAVSNRYMWLIGGPWAGKTALLAEAVFSMPDMVDVVAYFLAARESQASQEQFLAAVVPQLAWLLNVETPLMADIHSFRDLWERCSKRATELRRYLLLIVDGLDEDLRPGGRSVAAMLPAIGLNQSTGVVVASRTYPELPDDVDSKHPLRHAVVVQLSDSPYATGLRISAEQEINALLPQDLMQIPNPDLPFEVLGLLTAARGALSISDLASMMSARTSVIRIFTTRQAARSLEQVGQANEYRYQFAHQTLLEFCQNHPDVGGDEQYRQRLYKWADDWRVKGWPAPGIADFCTPRYLVDSYPASLMGDLADTKRRSESIRRLAELVSDLRWVHTAICYVGIESFLVMLRTVVDLVQSDESLDVIRQFLSTQIEDLRRPWTLGHSGYIATQMMWQALRLDMDNIVEAISHRLHQCFTPYIVPVWTSELARNNFSFFLGSHGLRNSALAVTREGWVVVGGFPRGLRLWRASRPSELSLLDMPFSGPAQAVAVMMDGWIVSGGLDGTVWLWDPANPRETAQQVTRHAGPVLSVAVTQDGRVVSGGYDGTVRCWEPTRPDQPSRLLAQHVNGVRTIVITTEGHVISGGLDGTIRLRNPTDPRDHGRVLHTTDPVFSLAVTTDGKIVSGGLGKSIWLWNLADPYEYQKIGSHNTVMALGITENGHVLSGDLDGGVRLTDPSKPDVSHVLARRRDGVSALRMIGQRQFIIASGRHLTLFELIETQ